MSTFWKVFLTIMGVGFVLAAAFVALVVYLFGSAANEVNKAIEEEEANDKPTVVAVGAAFDHDGYKVSKGWKIDVDEYGMATIPNLKITNTKKETAIPMLTFTFVDGDSKVGEMECNAGELEPKQNTVADCFSLDEKFPTKYTEVRVADMW